MRTQSTPAWLFSALLCSFGCASPNKIAATAPLVPYSALKGGQTEPFAQALRSPPYVLAFKAGDEIPLNFALESKLVELPVPPLTIRAKQDFWILMRADGPPLVSLDGKDFQAKTQNSFMFGIKVVRGEPPSVEGKIRYRAE